MLSNLIFRGGQNGETLDTLNTWKILLVSRVLLGKYEDIKGPLVSTWSQSGRTMLPLAFMAPIRTRAERPKFPIFPLSAGAALSILLLLGAMLFAAPEGKAASDQGCGDFQVVGLAGSGELEAASTSGTDFMGQTITDFYDKLKASYAGTGLTISEHGIPYLDRSVADMLLTPPILSAYSTSKNDGAAHALEYINSVCRSVPIVLAGYSQGADAAMDVYAKLGADQSRVLAVVLFGDPRFNPDLHPLDQGTYVQRPSGHGLLNGIFGARTADSAFQGKARSYCLYKDIMCNSQVSTLQAAKCAAAVGVARANPLRGLAGLVKMCPDVIEWIACVDNLLANKMNLPSLDCAHFDYRPSSTAAAVAFARTMIRPSLHLTGVQSVSIGSLATYVLKTDGTVWAWGTNTASELGDGTTRDSGVPVQVAGLVGVEDVVAETFSALALEADRTVWAWGSGGYGQLGNGTYGANTELAVPAQITGLTNVQSIGALPLSSFALKGDGTVWAWGNNSGGQLGNGTATDSSVPVQVTGLTDVRKIVMGIDLANQVEGGSCYAIKGDGTLWAWGNNSSGQLGNGTTTNSAIPVQVTGLTGVQKVSIFGAGALALKTDGTVWAWGNNSGGQLGIGTVSAPATVPVRVTSLTGVRDITTGTSGQQTYVVKGDGTVWGWGSNDYGQLGNGTTNGGFSSTPAQVPGLTGVRTIITTGSTVYALKNDTSLWSWGYNANGQLGNGTTTNSPTPVPVG